MIPKVAEENLADYIDVFCERGFFNPKQNRYKANSVFAKISLMKNNLITPMI